MIAKMLLKTEMSAINFHLKIGTMLRLLTILYIELHDRYFKLRFTDIDYDVFTDASRQILSKNSPYNVQTYRYSPIFAYLLMPNILLGPGFGKLFFILIDLLIGYCIYYIVNTIYQNNHKASQCAVLWLYNPWAIIIAARGNADCLPALLVLLTYLLHYNQKYLYSGLLLGLSVHLRLYPIIFLPPLYLSTGIFQTISKPVYQRLYSPWKLKLVFGFAFLFSLFTLTSAFYLLYGEEFLEQSILYHLRRVDTKHNFSVYFYVNYLVPNSDIQKYLPLAIQAILLAAISLKYSATTKRLSFCLFCNAFVFVIFNKVITCQYYIWFLSLLPLFLPSISMPKRKVITIGFTWLAAQLFWLIQAYRLEFLQKDAFSMVWVASIMFLLVNVNILLEFMKVYNNEFKTLKNL